MLIIAGSEVVWSALMIFIDVYWVKWIFIDQHWLAMIFIEPYFGSIPEIRSALGIDLACSVLFTQIIVLTSS